MSILPDHMIEEAVARGRIGIEPWLPSQVQPSSYDLRLGPIVQIGTPDGHREYDLSGGGLCLYEGQTALGATLELLVLPADIAGQIAGKSTLARLGLQICCDAGYVDPGWRGRLTLELRHTKPAPVRLTYGMLICQIVFHMMAAPAARPYGTPGLGSHYQGSLGPVTARTGPPPEAPDIGRPDRPYTPMPAPGGGCAGCHARHLKAPGDGEEYPQYPPGAHPVRVGVAP